MVWTLCIAQELEEPCFLCTPQVPHCLQWRTVWISTWVKYQCHGWAPYVAASPSNWFILMNCQGGKVHLMNQNIILTVPESHWYSQANRAQDLPLNPTFSQIIAPIVGSHICKLPCELCITHELEMPTADQPIQYWYDNIGQYPNHSWYSRQVAIWYRSWPVTDIKPSACSIGNCTLCSSVYSHAIKPSVSDKRAPNNNSSKGKDFAKHKPPTMCSSNNL